LNVSVAMVVGCQLQSASEEPVKNDLLEGHRSPTTTKSTFGVPDRVQRAPTATTTAAKTRAWS
jgi:hypothetical protein